MGNFEEQKRGMSIASLLSTLGPRMLPIVLEHSTIQEVIRSMIRFGHSRVLYVVNEAEQLTGTISLGNLARHVFSRSHEVQIHARVLISMITAETAKDMMQKKPVFAKKEEEVGEILKRMIESNVKEIAILDDERKVIGDVTMIDLLKFLLNGGEQSEGEDTREH
jgi:CBS domain-containing protein